MYLIVLKQYTVIHYFLFCWYIYVSECGIMDAVTLFDKYRVTLDEDLRATKEGVLIGAFAPLHVVSVSGAPCVAKRLEDVISVTKKGEPCGEEEWRGVMERLGSVCHLLSCARHPNIAQFIGLHLSSGDGRDVAIVTEKLFISLEWFISTYAGAPLSLKLHILKDVSSGVRYLHSAMGVAHGSLQAGAVLLTQDLQAKVTDLEVSRVMEHTAAQMRDYLPPEALSTPPTSGPETDSFSFGHLSLYLINEVYPQPSDEGADDAPAASQLQTESRRQWLDQIASDHCLHNLIISCLSDQPSARPAMEAINLQLAQLCQQHPKSLAEVLHLLQPSRVSGW